MKTNRKLLDGKITDKVLGTILSLIAGMSIFLSIIFFKVEIYFAAIPCVILAFVTLVIWGTTREEEYTEEELQLDNVDIEIVKSKNLVFIVYKNMLLEQYDSKEDYDTINSSTKFFYHNIYMRNGKLSKSQLYYK